MEMKIGKDETLDASELTMPNKRCQRILATVSLIFISLMFSLPPIAAADLPDGWNAVDSGGVGHVWDISF